LTARAPDAKHRRDHENITHQEPGHRVNRRHRHRVLVVCHDGRLVLKVRITPASVLAAAMAALALLAGVAVVTADWWRLRTVAQEARAGVDELARARRAIDTVERRIAELQRDAAAWRELHARIWRALGPESDTSAARRGVGGRALAPMPARGSGASELEALALSVKEESESLRALDRVMERAGKMLAALPMRWPMRGEVNSDFGPRTSPWSGARELHTGVDIGAKHGTPVHAPAAGTVEHAGAHPDYGLSVVIDHGHDVRTVYGHLSQVASRRGQRIERGALIGLTGNTGRSSGPHLHYEILVHGRAINPRAYLWD
jgi:murein DD-endopeptidase MepM/ murein hydrolase activator NlpD